MKWPFFEYRSTGIYVGREDIYIVTLSQIRDRLRIISAGHQEIESRSHSEALTELISKHHLKGSTVSVNVDPAKTQVSVKKLSVPLKDIEVDKWLKEHSEKLLPSGMAEGDFLKSHVFTGGDNEVNFCNSLLIRQDTVNELVAMCDEAGAKISRIACSPWTSGYAFLFEPSFVSGIKAVLSLSEVPMLILYKDGQFLKSIELEAGTSDKDLLLEVESKLQETESLLSLPKNECEVVVCPSFGESKDNISNFVSSLGLVRSFVFLKPLANISEDKQLAAEYTPAVGMAISGLYPDLKQVNLLSGQKQLDCELEIQKKDMLNFVLSLGGATFLLLLLLNLYQWHLGSRLSQAEEELLKVSDKITQMAKLRSNVIQLREEFTGAQKLVTQRTQTARMLDLVGEAVPSRVWLTELSYNGNEGDKIRIKGFTSDEQKLILFLEELEKLSVIEDIRLNYSRSGTAEDLQPDANLRFEAFTLFQIQGRMASS